MPCRLDACIQGRRPCPDRAVCFPDVEDDNPATPTPEEAMGWIVPAQGFVLLVVIFCAVMAARYFFF